MTIYPAEASTHPVVRNALSLALGPISELELLRVLAGVRVTRFESGAPILLGSAPELRVVALGVVAAMRESAKTARHFVPGQILPSGAGGSGSELYRALREVLVAHVPCDALEGHGVQRLLRALMGDVPVPSRRPSLLVGVSGADHRLATEFHRALGAALERHGTVSSAEVEIHGRAMPTRLALADLFESADFQLALFPPPGGPSDVPAVDRWLYVVDGKTPGDGRPMPRKRSSGYAAAVVRPGSPIPATHSLRFQPTRGEAGLSPRTLVLSHDRSLRIPRQTDRHLAFHRPDDHRHARRGHVGDHARLARELAGVPIGFTLGAGGARGLAHLGALHAADEEGIPIDYLSGTSIGAVIGGLVGLGYDSAARREAAERLASARPFSDFTLPTTALLRGRRFEALAEEFFGRVDLADLWIPMVTTTCELGDFHETVHRRGPLGAILLAGTVLPGVLPPRILDGKLHVDGGTSNMLPVELLRAHSPGAIVAVDVSPWDAIAVPTDGYPVGTDALFARLRGKPAPLGALQVFWRAVSYSVAARARAEGATADLLISPDVGSVGTSDLDGLREIETAGYFAAKAAFASDAATRLRVGLSSGTATRR